MINKCYLKHCDNNTANENGVCDQCFESTSCIAEFIIKTIEKFFPNSDDDSPKCESNEDICHD